MNKRMEIFIGYFSIERERENVNRGWLFLGESLMEILDLRHVFDRMMVSFNGMMID